MKTKSFVITTLGATQSPWHRIEHRDSFNVGVYVDLAQASDANYGVDLGFCDLSHDQVQGVNITRSGTVATINSVNPYLLAAKTGDSIVVQGAGAPFDGVFALTNTAGVLTYTVANSGPTQSNLGNGVSVSLIRVFAFNTAQTAGAAFSIQTPCDFVRVNIASSTVGQVAVTIVQGND